MFSLKKPSALLLALLSLSMVTVDANAAVTNANNDYFQNLYNMAQTWSTGYLARSIAIFSFLLGALGGMVRGSAIPPLIGFGFAVLFSIGPTIITGIMGAVI